MRQILYEFVIRVYLKFICIYRLTPHFHCKKRKNAPLAQQLPLAIQEFALGTGLKDANAKNGTKSG
jgi:hypothetical protein